MDKRRPVLVLTREVVLPHRSMVTVAPITSARRGLATEIPVGQMNGIDHDSVVNVDNILTIPAADLGRLLGYLPQNREAELSAAIQYAFDLE